MKSLPFKLFVSIFIAFAIACTQFSISAQFSSKEEAQSALYMIANTTSQSLDKVSNPQAQIDEFSYDGKDLTIVISTIMPYQDIRYLTTDFLILQFHNTINLNSRQAESFLTISKLLRVAESNLTLIYRDTEGHQISHQFTPNDIDNILSKSIEELGIDKEQMSNYCILYHNNTIKKEIDGKTILDAEATKEGDFVKISYSFIYPDKTMELMTKEYLKNIFFSLTSYGYYNLLDACGYKGVIYEVKNYSSYKDSVVITLEEIAQYHSTPQSSSDTSLANNPTVKSILEIFNNISTPGDSDGVIGINSSLHGTTIDINYILANNNSNIYSINAMDMDFVKDGFIKNLSSNQGMATYLNQLHNEGITHISITYSIKDSNDIKNTVKIPITDFFDNTDTQQSSNNNDVSAFEAVQSLIANIDASYKENIGEDGVVDAYVKLSGEYIEITQVLDEVEDNASEYESTEMQELMRMLLKNTLQENASILSSIGIKGFIYTFINQYDRKTVSITIDFDQDLSDSYSELSNDNDISSFEDVQAYIADIDAAYKDGIGKDGVVDAYVKLSGEYIEATEVLDGINDDISYYTPEDEFKEFMLVTQAKDKDNLNEFKQLQQQGIKGIIFTFINQTDKESVSITLDFAELFEFVESQNQSSDMPQSSESSIEEYISSLTDEDKEELTTTFLQSMEDEAKKGIGYNGITNVQVFTSGDYATVLLSIKGAAEHSDLELMSIKQDIIREFKNDELMTTSIPIIQQAIGIKGLKYIYKDEDSYRSATITIDWNEILNDNSSSYSDDEFDFSDASTDEFREIFVQEFDKSIKEEIGKDGVSDAWAKLSGEALVIDVTFDSTVDFNDIGDLNEIKNELIQDMTTTEKDIEMCYVLYYLDIKNLKFVIHSDSSRIERSFTISIEDIVNGTFVPEEVQYNEI
ncbi:MAG: hypothetical protein II990_08780 [Muribaculaceae bacterium]|nr:hypothetical protein [Muribaculaceae bacterium]